MNFRLLITQYSTSMPLHDMDVLLIMSGTQSMHEILKNIMQGSSLHVIYDQKPNSMTPTCINQRLHRYNFGFFRV